MREIIPYKLKDLSDDQLALLPSEEDVRIYEERGWHVTPQIIPDDVLDAAHDAVARYYNGERDFELSATEAIADDAGTEDMVIRNNEFTTLQKLEFQKLGFHKMIVASAAVLAKTSGIRLFADSLISKKPAKGEEKGIVGWHSDKAYWPTCTSDKMLTAWIPLQDVTLDMGPLMHIDNSHKWKNEQKLKSFYSFNNQNLNDFNTYLENEKPDHQRSYMTIKRGQVSFHNCHTIHSSHPNTSQADRIALAVHFQDENNRYKKAYKEDGSLIAIGYDKLCQPAPGTDPDYSNPSLFPLVFN